MLTLLENARVLTPAGWLDPGYVLIQEGRIAGAGRGAAPSAAAERIDLGGLTLVPGFIDLHVHGGGGFTLATRDPDEIRSYARWVVRHGVTGFLPTIVGGSAAEGLAFCRTAAEVVGPVDGGADVLGINLEGPFVSPSRPGALPRAWLQEPDPALFRDLAEAAAGALRVMTVAPELPGADAVLAEARSRGVVVSAGHSEARYEEAAAGFEAGASHVTHVFNAMRPLHHRDPGIVGAALDCDGVTVEVIADGVHLHPAAVRLLVSAFGSDRIALVTDAVTPAGLGRGTFRIGDREARLEGDRVSLPDGTIAGSAATMDLVVRNIVQWGIADLPAAAGMASAVPARVLGMGGRKGAVAPGFEADLVALDSELRVAAAWSRGRPVFRGPGP